MRNGRNGKDLNCETCGKLFYVTPSRLKKNKHHTCSGECFGKLASKLHSKKVKTNCHVCKKEIEYKQSHYKQIVTPTCSILCASIAKSERIKGQQNPKALKLTELERFFWEKTKGCKLRADAQKIPFNLDYKYLEELYNKQEGKCHYTGIEMILKSKKDRKLRAADWNVLSVDKIIPELGYTKDNVVLTLNCINMLKAHHSLDVLTIVFNAMVMKNKRQPLNVKKLFEDSLLPKQSDDLAAGHDIFVHRFEDCGEYIKVYSGIAIEPKLGTFFMLVPRSSSFKRGLTLYNNIGIIDVNYSGEIIGIFLKTSEYKNDIKKGDRLLQLIPQEQIWIDVNEVDELSSSNRGADGFGSSGR